MKIYRIVVRQDGRLLGHFESEVPWALEAISIVEAEFAKNPGFQFERLVAEEERRLIQAGPEGVRVLNRELVFKPIT